MIHVFGYMIHVSRNRFLYFGSAVFCISAMQKPCDLISVWLQEMVVNVFFVSMTPIQRLNLWNTLKILLRYGECILRFDDTNPEAESVEYIENIIDV